MKLAFSDKGQKKDGRRTFKIRTDLSKVRTVCDGRNSTRGTSRHGRL